MRKLNLVKTVFFLGLTLVSIVACNDFEKELEVYTDVYVVNKKFDSVVKSAAAYFAYANKDIMSGSVALPGNGGNVELAKYPGSIFTLAKEPADSAFKTTAPAKGIYTFTVKDVDGIALTITDNLNFEGLGIPQFTKIKFSSAPFLFETEWNAVEGADGYFLKMFNTEGKLIFSGYSVASTVLKYNITEFSTSGYWSETAIDGKPYILQLNAYTNDAEATSANYVYNLSEVSIGVSPIIWGVNN